MNKFKKWLIRKLGGEVKMSDLPEVRVGYEYVHLETIKTRVPIPESFEPDDEELRQLLRGLVAKQLGYFLLDKDFLRIIRKFDIDNNREYIEASLKIAVENGSDKTDTVIR